jgi:phenylalanyl-tRNA synthetase beta chain
MPTITCTLRDLNLLTGHTVSAEELHDLAQYFKGEVKGYDREKDELRIELLDTNRPDLWSVEGIARQLRFRDPSRRPVYDWIGNRNLKIAGIIIDHSEMQLIRPYVGGIAVRGLDVSEDVLVACIQTQEKLAGNFGRNRKSISIGIYDLNQIVFPVHYKAVGLDEVSFVPLGYDVPMSPRQILATHPKGIEFRYTLEGLERVPMLVDDAGGILSFPPIINSRQSGEVKVGKRDLFIEATGTDLENLILVLNIFAANLADRGGSIEGVTVHFEFDTPHGRDLILPRTFDQSTDVSVAYINTVLGVEFDAKRAAEALENYGYTASANGATVRAEMPPWRRDLIHDVDVIEDVAISSGYSIFEPEMPENYTIGKLAPMTLFSDRIRDIVLAFGFEEVISNILCNRLDFGIKMRELERDLIEIRNPMTETYSCVRDRILPSLLKIERDSSSAPYPHRIFEVGEVSVKDPCVPKGCASRNRLCVMIADRTSEFSSAHSFLETLLFTLGLESQLQAVDRLEFIPGRSGTIMIRGTEAGLIGEVHPEILENFQIGMPCCAFELDLEILRSLISGKL